MPFETIYLSRIMGSCPGRQEMWHFSDLIPMRQASTLGKESVQVQFSSVQFKKQQQQLLSCFGDGAANTSNEAQGVYYSSRGLARVSFIYA